MERLQESMGFRLVYGRINEGSASCRLIFRASPKVFSVRLKQLERDGILICHVMVNSPPTVEYVLTDLGHELTPAIDAHRASGT
jgi:DNA-binding HxlR family transcriptional regulator